MARAGGRHACGGAAGVTLAGGASAVFRAEAGPFADILAAGAVNAAQTGGAASAGAWDLGKRPRS